MSRFVPGDLYELLDMIKASFSTRELNIVYDEEPIKFLLSEYLEEKIIEAAKTKHLYIAKLGGKIVVSGIVEKENLMKKISIMNIKFLFNSH